MAEESFQEKTEKPTDKRKEHAREEGQVARSRELASVSVVFTGMISLLMFAGYIHHQLSIVMSQGFGMLSITDIDLAGCKRLINNSIYTFILIIAPILIVVFLTGIFANLVQVGFNFTSKPLEPKFTAISPLSGLKRLFGFQALSELIKSLWKLAIIGGIAYYTIKSEFKTMLPLAHMGVSSILIYAMKIIFKLFLRVTIAMLVMAIADYAFQRWQFEKKLRMTKQETKEENKQMEGDPRVKSRIRSIQYKMAKARMMQDVPKADVVVTNPTHLALAISYDSSSMRAPKILAKGANIVAEKIKEIARQHDITIVENKVLAQALYKLVEIGQEVPSQFYQAVAEVLAYVYKLKGRVL
ncbi:MAG: flagellar biosynthesis protein FlhB [Pseudomonadota bacterium]